MSNRCPPEIIDCIIDLLLNDPETLRQCCLVSKSWVPRCRQHLFAVTKFRTPGDIEAWKKMFPGPSNSPTTSPALTGTLEFLLFSGTAHFVRRLLDLPNGLHFRKLKLTWREEESLRSAVGLVEACSDTLEFLDIKFEGLGGYTPRSSINLSKATKLKDVVFRFQSLQSDWIVMALEDVTTKHIDLQRISIHLPSGIAYDDLLLMKIYQANPYTKWFYLDHLLVKLWESRPIRARIVYPQGAKDCAEYRFPEITRRGIADLVGE